MHYGVELYANSQFIILTRFLDKWRYFIISIENLYTFYCCALNYKRPYTHTFDIFSNLKTRLLNLL